MSVIEKASNFGNPFIGIFAKTNDDITFVGNGVSDKFMGRLVQLKTDIVRMSVLDCDLIGLYSVVNSKGLLVAPMFSAAEIGAVKKMVGNRIRIETLKTKLTAIGNNVVANDFGAIVNPEMSETEIAKVKDVLGVEVVRSKIAGYSTVGAVVIATNSGFAAHPKASPEELDLLASVLHVHGGVGTMNNGVPFPGISAIANKKSFVAGESTTGYELGRINDCLGFMD